METSALWAALTGALEQARAEAKRIDRGPGGREIALVITKLQEAQHWLGAADVAREPTPPKR